MISFSRPFCALSLFLFFFLSAASFAQGDPYGPQAGITRPSGAVDIPLGTDIQTAVNAQPGNTVFWIKAGVRYLTSAITPKTGDTFVGEYGAILDGTGWTTTELDQGAFRAHNQDIDDVTIRNLVIRNMPQTGIHAFYWMSDRWTIEYNEIASNGRMGVNLPHLAIVRHCYIHHNAVAGYAAYHADSVLIEDNEISYNTGSEQKFVYSVGTTFRNNFVHHNTNGIWYDGENTKSLIEGNTVEDNTYEGIFYEVSGQGIIRNNFVRRNGNSGIFISTSHSVEVYGNVLENNFRGINVYVQCDREHLPPPTCNEIGEDCYLGDVSVHNNVILFGAKSGDLANCLGISNCDSAQISAIAAGQRNIAFTANRYYAPDITASWWSWLDASKSWSVWQGLGNDLTGSFQLSSAYTSTRSPFDVNKLATPFPVPLLSCYPNAFNPVLTVRFNLDNKFTSPHRLEIFNMDGKRVWNRRFFSTQREVVIDGGSHGFSSGVYLVQLKTGKTMLQKRVFLVK